MTVPSVHLWLTLIGVAGCGTPPTSGADASFLSIDRRSAVPDGVRDGIVEIAHPAVEVTACGGDARVALSIVGGTDPDSGAGHVLAVDGRVVDGGGWTVGATVPESPIDVLPTQDQVQGLPMRITCLQNAGAELRTEVVTATSDGRVLTVE